MPYSSMIGRVIVGSDLTVGRRCIVSAKPWGNVTLLGQNGNYAQKRLTSQAAMKANGANLEKPQAGLLNVGVGICIDFFNYVCAAWLFRCFFREPPGLGRAMF